MRGSQSRTPSPTIATLHSAGNKVPSVAWSKQAKVYIDSRKATADELFSTFALVLDKTLNALPGYTDEDKLKVAVLGVQTYRAHVSTVYSVGQYKAYMKVIRMAGMIMALFVSTIHGTSLGAELREKAEEKKIEFFLQGFAYLLAIMAIIRFCP